VQLLLFLLACTGQTSAPATSPPGDDAPDTDDTSTDSGRPTDTADTADPHETDCTDGPELELSAAQAPDSTTTLVVEATVDEAASIELTVGEQASGTAMRRTLDHPGGPIESIFWGLTPETTATIWLEVAPLANPEERWCPPPVEVSTGALAEPVHESWEVVLDSGVELPPLRILTLWRDGEGINRIVLHDETGQELWARVVDGVREVNKSALRDTTGEGALMLSESRRQETLATLHAVPATGEQSSWTAPGALHHGFALTEDGEVIASGWELRDVGEHTLLGDTLVRFRPGDTEWTELWNAFEALELPSEEEVDSWPNSSGIYDGDVVTWTYLNYVGYDAASGRASAVLAGSIQGAVAVGLDGGNGWTLVHGTEGLTVDGDSPELFSLFHNGHSVAIDGDDRVLYYNRRSPDVGTTLDAWTYDSETTSVTSAGQYTVADPDGEALHNDHAGNAWPLDGVLGAEGGLILAFHPAAGGVFDVLTDPWAPDSASPGTATLLRQLAPTASLDSELEAGFAAAYSLPTLNAAEAVPWPDGR